MTGTTNNNASLYRTDLATGKTTRAMGWRPWQDAHQRTCAKLTYSSGAASNLFPYRGKLFFLQDQHAVVHGDNRAEIQPGFHAQLRLAELDPRRTRYTSTFLKLTPDGMTDTAEGQVSIPATGMSAGHLRGHTLYTGDAQGDILAVDLQTKRLRNVGHLSDAGMKARDVTAAWNGTTLTLVVFRSGREGHPREVRPPQREALLIAACHRLRPSDQGRPDPSLQRGRYLLAAPTSRRGLLPSGLHPRRAPQIRCISLGRIAVCTSRQIRMFRDDDRHP